MSGVNLQAIYDRLRNVPAYHPMSANTYADWSMEAGDMVTVSRNGKAYKSPVGSSTVKWTGKQQIQIQSEGSRERDPISRVSARKYATGGGGTSGIRANQSLYYEMFSEDGQLHAVISATAESLTSDYSKKIEDQNIELRGVVTQTAESLTSDYSMKIGDLDNALRGVIRQTAESLTSDYSNKITETESHFEQRAEQIELSVSNMDKRLSAQIAVTDRTASMSVGRVKFSNTAHYANKASFPAVGRSDTLYYADDTRKAYIYIPEAHFYAPAAVDEYGNANYIKAGEIVIAINENGNTEAKLDADVIYAGKNTKQTLAGLELPDWMDTTKGLIAEKATIVDLKAVDARVETLEADAITTKNLSASISNLNGVTVKVLDVGSVSSPAVEMTSSGMTSRVLFSARGGIQDASGHVYNVYDAGVSGNTLTIYKLDGTTINFSKATSLSGSWSGSIYTVTASPQNVKKTIGFGSSADVQLSVYHGSASVFKNDRDEENKNFLSLPTYVESVGDGAGGGNMNRYSTTPAISIASMREALSVTSNGTYTPSAGKVGFSSVVVDVPSSSGEISIPRGNIYTTDKRPSGTNASTLRNNYEQARSDGEYVVFQVTCGDASRWYYMEP